MPDFSYINTDQLPGRTLTLDGREYLFCSGTSYLGMARNKQFQEYVVAGMARYGTNYSSSRNSNLQLPIFEETEAYLAAYTGAPAALTMSSGYLAGQALMHTVARTGKIIYAPGAHPAVWQPLVASPSTDTYEHWVTTLLSQIPAFPEDHIIIVSNSVDPLKAQKYDFNWLLPVSKYKQITLVVDDSHGFGVIGEDGAGIYQELRQIPGVRVVVAASMGKAMGIPAGFILGDTDIIAQVRATAYFGGASPAIPAYLYAYLQANELFREARQTLLANLKTFKAQLAQPAAFQYFENYPVFYTPEETLAAYLFHNQVIVSSFRYPTPTDVLINRVVLSSLHTAADIHRVTQLINRFAFQENSN